MFSKYKIKNIISWSQPLQTVHLNKAMGEEYVATQNHRR